MRRLVVETLALILVLTGMSIGLGQQAHPPVAPGAPTPPKTKEALTKSKLEEMLAEALKNNPDIRVAAAKVAEADAELNRTRLQVTQKVVALYYAIDTQKKVVPLQEEKLALRTRLRNNGQISADEFVDAQQALTLAKAKLAELEAQMPAVLGKVAHAAAGDVTVPIRLRIVQLSGLDLSRAKWEVHSLVDAPRAAGPMADRIRKALTTPVKPNYKDARLSEILKDLQKDLGLSFRHNSGGGDLKRTVQFEEALPVSAVLQALADDFDVSFVVREYGILVTEPKAAPPGALTVQEFLRQKPAGK